MPHETIENDSSDIVDVLANPMREFSGGNQTRELQWWVAKVNIE